MTQKNCKVITSTPDKYELEVVECTGCGFHLGIDASYLEQVDGVGLLCPSCGMALVIGGEGDAEEKEKEKEECTWSKEDQAVARSEGWDLGWSHAAGPTDSVAPCVCGSGTPAVRCPCQTEAENGPPHRQIVALGEMKILDGDLDAVLHVFRRASKGYPTAVHAILYLLAVDPLWTAAEISQAVKKGHIVPMGDAGPIELVTQIRHQYVNIFHRLRNGI
jgi:hypothetical protein